MFAMEPDSQKCEAFSALFSLSHAPNLTNIVLENATSTISDMIEAANCDKTSDMHDEAHAYPSSIDQTSTIGELAGKPLTEYMFWTHLNCCTVLELRSMFRIWNITRPRREPLMITAPSLKYAFVLSDRTLNETVPKFQLLLQAYGLRNILMRVSAHVNHE